MFLQAYVKNSVHGGGGIGGCVHTPNWQTHPLHGIHPPWYTHPLVDTTALSQTTPLARRPLQRTVRILLENAFLLLLLTNEVNNWPAKWQFTQKQECIPVGCVPPAAVAVPGGFSIRHPPWDQAPPRNQTPRSRPPGTRHLP